MGEIRGLSYLSDICPGSDRTRPTPPAPRRRATGPRRTPTSLRTRVAPPIRPCTAHPGRPGYRACKVAINPAAPGPGAGDGVPHIGAAGDLARQPSDRARGCEEASAHDHPGAACEPEPANRLPGRAALAAQGTRLGADAGPDLRLAAQEGPRAGGR